MSAYEPGTVAVATVRGVEGVRVMRTNGIGGADTIWLSAVFAGHFRGHPAEAVTDIRPLVVLDLGDYDNRAVTYLRNIARDDLAYDGSKTPRSKLVDLIADQIEAQTKPPRIPEPGWGQKVRARTLGNGHEREFLRYKADDPDFRWADGHEQYRWSDLIDPTLIREGLS